MPTHAERRVLPYSAEDMFNLVAGVEKYPEFLPWVISSTVKERKEASFLADLTVGYKFLRETYTSEVILTPYRRIDVNYLSGPFKKLNNHWIFESLSENSVALDFYIDFEFKSSLLQSLMQTVFSEIIKQMIGAFEKRARQVCQGGVN